MHVRFGGGQREKQVKLLALCLPYWLAPHVVRIAKLLTELQEDVSVTFWDYDAVEAKNIYRQNFCSAEVGMNKASALAHRYGLAWGIPIHVVEEPFASRHGALSKSLQHFYHWDRNVVLVTSVDRNAARQEVARVCNDYPTWWVDTGNLKTSGQVAVGRELLENEANPLRLPSVTTWTPSPSLQFPNIMKNGKEETQPMDYTHMSCAELALADEQGISINHSIASAAASLLARMLVTRDLRYHCAYVSLEAGTQFAYSSPRILRKHLKTAKGVG
ncbi:MAG TPA: ThiF family adenylyltransferase [Anaerolineales bacterium]|nr:ThiF family adenylyltransferase [Anaerolineales bacterium]